MKRKTASTALEGFSQPGTFRLFAARFLFFLIATAGLGGCYEAREGCLDINATNFKVDSDRPCDGCCTYPSFRVDLRHLRVFPDTVYTLQLNDSAYLDNAGNNFRVRSAIFFLSDFKVIRANGEEAGVQDTLQLNLVQGNDTLIEVVEDNFALATAGTFRVRNLGNITSSGAFQKLEFTAGLSSPASKALPGPLADDHPLATPALYQNLNQGRLLGRVEIYRITASADTVSTRIDIPMPASTPRLSFSLPFFLDPGFNLRAVIVVDYRRLFAGWNVVSDSPNQLADKIVNNLTNSLDLLEIVAEKE